LNESYWANSPDRLANEEYPKCTTRLLLVPAQQAALWPSISAVWGKLRVLLIEAGSTPASRFVSIPAGFTRLKIKQRAAQFVAEEMSLGELRRAHKLTQGSIAQTLGIGQDQVSRLEQRSDLLISTLRGYVEAMGGRRTLIAEFLTTNPWRYLVLPCLIQKRMHDALKYQQTQPVFSGSSPPSSA
jgi:hypothetical protein